MEFFGIRYLLDEKVIKVFLDAGWERRAQNADLVPGKDYNSMQVLKRGGFDEWVPYKGYNGYFRNV